ncbi:MAG TPA: TIGR00730 family Rossman fold protein [Candidatus Competibacteraceae bacterium]|nr:TIGR00730 family Rossman fold protein [Candidatus Competibacteraceae bacterium]
MKRICVYCGANTGHDPRYTAAARALGRTLAEHGLGLVYGGGRVGLMGVVADAALAAGGEVIGVIPELLMRKEVGHRDITELYEVATMHERKALMVELADAFIALPGGLGTLDELFEILTWGQLGLHGKPVGLLNVNGFFDGLKSYLDHAMGQGFIKPAHRAMLLEAEEPAALLERFAAYRAPQLGKWGTLQDA